MSTIRLVVLGLIRHQGQAHGYALHSTLEAWQIQTWTRHKPGSIYHALKQLTKEGKLLEVGEESSARGPGKTLYRLSTPGEEEFFSRLREALKSFDLETLSVGVAFMHALSREEVLAAMEALQHAAADNASHLDALVPGHTAHRHEPPHMVELLELWSGSLEATAAWAKRLAQKLRQGEFVMAGEEELTSARSGA